MGGPEVTLEDFPEKVLSGVILMDMQGLGKSWLLVLIGSFSNEETQPSQGKPRQHGLQNTVESKCIFFQIAGQCAGGGWRW